MLFFVIFLSSLSMEIKIPQGCENGGAFLHPSPHPCGSLSDSGTISLHERISSGKLFCNVKSPGIFLFRDGYYHNPRYHPHCKRINAYHSIRLTRVHVLTYSSFSPSAPECSLSAPSLQQRSQSVTPYSCQVPKQESPSLPFFYAKYLSTFAF